MRDLDDERNDAARDALRGLGLDEVVSYGFVGAASRAPIPRRRPAARAHRQPAARGAVGHAPLAPARAAAWRCSATSRAATATCASSRSARSSCRAATSRAARRALVRGGPLARPRRRLAQAGRRRSTSSTSRASSRSWSRALGHEPRCEPRAPGQGAGAAPEHRRARLRRRGEASASSASFIPTPRARSASKGVRSSSSWTCRRSR